MNGNRASGRFTPNPASAGAAGLLVRACSLLLAGAILAFLCTGLFVPTAEALNGQGGKSFQFLGYRYLDARHLQIWFDKNLPQANANPEQLRIYEGTEPTGSYIVPSALDPATDKNQSIPGMPTGSSYVLQLAAAMPLRVGHTYTVQLANNLTANNRVTLGAYALNRDPVFSFAVPAAGSNYDSAIQPVVRDWLDDGAAGVPVEGMLWFALSVPAAHPQEVLSGIRLKADGRELSSDTTLDANPAAGAAAYAPQTTADGTFFFLPLSGSGGTAAYDLAFHTSYTLEIPQIVTVNGRSIPARSIHFQTVSQDVPPPMNTTVQGSQTANGIRLDWSPLAFADGYSLYRSDNPYWGFQKSALSPLQEPGCQIDDLAPGETRYYRIAGWNAAGVGGMSPAIRVFRPEAGTAGGVEFSFGADSASGSGAKGLLQIGPDGIMRVDTAQAAALIQDSAQSGLALDLSSFPEAEGAGKAVRLPADTVAGLIASGKPLQIGDGAIRMTVPAKALSSGAAMTYGAWTPAAGSLPAAPANTVKRKKLAIKAIAGTTDLYTAAAPVSVAIDVPDGVADPDKLAAYTLNADTGRWEFAGGRADGKQFVFHTSRFTAILLAESDKTFRDIANHWARHSIEVMAARQIVSGTGADAFSPQQAVSRAELAVMLAHALQLPDGGSAKAWKDVPASAWYFQDVQRAAAAGIVQGDGGSFRPKDAVSRQEMAVMLMKAYHYTVGRSGSAAGSTGAAGNPNGGAGEGKAAVTDDNAGEGTAAAVGGNSAPKFTDSSLLADWARDSVTEAFRLGLLQGNPDGSFGGTAKMTRAEAAAVLYKLTKLLPE